MPGMTARVVSSQGTGASRRGSRKARSSKNAPAKLSRRGRCPSRASCASTFPLVHRSSRPRDLSRSPRVVMVSRRRREQVRVSGIPISLLSRVHLLGEGRGIYPLARAAPARGPEPPSRRGASAMQCLKTLESGKVHVLPAASCSVSKDRVMRTESIMCGSYREAATCLLKIGLLAQHSSHSPHAHLPSSCSPRILLMRIGTLRAFGQSAFDTLHEEELPVVAC